MKIYFLISFSFSLVMGLIVGFTQTKKLFDFNNYISLIAYVLLWCAGAWSIYYAILRLTKPGISGSERSLVLYRHAIGILIFLLTNFYVICGCFYEAFNFNMPSQIPSETPAWVKFLKALFLSEGLISPLVRLFEPAFRKSAANQLY